MIRTLADGFVLRPARAADHAAMSRVCLETGDAGRDATAREDDPTLLGAIYAVPYQVLEPDLAFVVDGPDGVCGYVLGASDTRRFNARLAADWYPALRDRVSPAPDDRLRWRGSDWARHLIHHPDLDVPAALGPYPSHAHIDLLPEARGRGIGRTAIAFLEQRLIGMGSPGAHLGVDPRNGSALAFYRALGYATLDAPGLSPDAVFMVKAFGQ